MSKMGISTYQSYCGAQIFEAVGLQKAFVDKYFTGTSSNVEGIGLFEVAEEAARLHALAFGDDPLLRDMLDAGGEYHYRSARRSAHVDAGDRSRSCSTRRARTATRPTGTTRISSTSRAAS